mmetsp:Transcript_12723/g.24503  ORF Transcript_12723/g.24503 Transcript_12723/m.24503 type:complete len:218 (-) Transcript_12723:548-1201(-)
MNAPLSLAAAAAVAPVLAMAAKALRSGWLPSGWTHVRAGRADSIECSPSWPSTARPSPCINPAPRAPPPTWTYALFSLVTSGKSRFRAVTTSHASVCPPSTASQHSGPCTENGMLPCSLTKLRKAVTQGSPEPAVDTGPYSVLMSDPSRLQACTEAPSCCSRATTVGSASGGMHTSIGHSAAAATTAAARPALPQLATARRRLASWLSLLVCLCTSR